MRPDFLNLFQAYRLQLSGIIARYSDLLSLEEIPEDSEVYESYLKELRPHWLKLASAIRKIKRREQRR